MGTLSWSVCICFSDCTGASSCCCFSSLMTRMVFEFQMDSGSSQIVATSWRFMTMVESRDEIVAATVDERRIPEGIHCRCLGYDDRDVMLSVGGQLAVVFFQDLDKLSLQ